LSFQRYREVYKNLELIHKKIIPDVHRRKWLIGEWTDESDMMILILQTIIVNKGEVMLKTSVSNDEVQITQC
jgi:hypothetical protein